MFAVNFFSVETPCKFKSLLEFHALGGSILLTLVTWCSSHAFRIRRCTNVAWMRWCGDYVFVLTVWFNRFLIVSLKVSQGCTNKFWRISLKLPSAVNCSRYNPLNTVDSSPIILLTISRAFDVLRCENLSEPRHPRNSTINRENSENPRRTAKPR